MAAVSAFLLWSRVFYWLSLFTEPAFYFDLIIKTIKESKDFMIIILIFFMMFGSTIYFLNLDSPPGDEFMTSRFGFPFIDIFQSQYEHTLGEFNLDSYENVEENYFMVVFFTVATFLVIIVLFNMLIAIMGEIFALAMENRE